MDLHETLAGMVKNASSACLERLFVFFVVVVFGVLPPPPPGPQKRSKSVDLHKTLAGVVQTHHRPILRVILGPEVRKRGPLKSTESALF